MAAAPHFYLIIRHVARNNTARFFLFDNGRKHARRKIKEKCRHIGKVGVSVTLRKAGSRQTSLRISSIV